MLSVRYECRGLLFFGEYLRGTLCHHSTKLDDAFLTHSTHYRNSRMPRVPNGNALRHTAIHSSMLQHAATHCNTLQHTSRENTATQCKPQQHTAIHCKTLQHNATHCNTLQYPATHCSTLHHVLLLRLARLSH